MTQEIVRALVDGVWVTEVASASGGSQPNTVTYADTVTYAELVAAGPGHTKQLRELPDGSVVISCGVIVTEEFNSTGADAGFAIVDAGGSDTLFDFTTVDLTSNGNYGPYSQGFAIVPSLTTRSIPLIATGDPLPLIFNLASFAGDGSTGSVVVFTTIYTPTP